MCYPFAVKEPLPHGILDPKHRRGDTKGGSDRPEEDACCRERTAEGRLTSLVSGQIGPPIQSVHHHDDASVEAMLLLAGDSIGRRLAPAQERLALGLHRMVVSSTPSKD